MHEINSSFLTCSFPDATYNSSLKSSVSTGLHQDKSEERERVRKRGEGALKNEGEKVLVSEESLLPDVQQLHPPETSLLVSEESQFGTSSHGEESSHCRQPLVLLQGNQG